MEIAPVSGIRIVSPVASVRVGASMPPALAIDPSARADDACTAGRQTPDRGMEEDGVEEDVGDDKEIVASSLRLTSTISIIV